MRQALLSVILSLMLIMPAAAQVAPSGAAQARDNLKQDVQIGREDLKKAIEEKRAQLQSQIEAKRAQLQERLKKIKDERKKAAVEKIDRQLTELNDRMLAHFTDLLKKLENVLGRISSRADKANARGLDVTAVRQAIADADKAIVAAREAVKAQAGKTYSVVVNTEATLKVDVQKARQALHADLKKVSDAVRAAREAVQQAAVKLAQIPKVDEEPAAPAQKPSNTQ